MKRINSTRIRPFFRASILALLSLIVTACPSLEQPLPSGYTLTQPQPGVAIIKGDADNQGTSFSTKTTHQNGANYWVEKTLYVPQQTLQGKTQARVRVLMSLLDTNPGSEKIRLQESFELLVNGHSHVYADRDPALPISSSGQIVWQWHDFIIPVDELKAGANTFVFHKTPSANNKDFLYIGIDNSVSYMHSRCSLDSGKTWSRESLNTVGAKGEYMVRLVLLKESPQRDAQWTPQGLNDPHHLIGYAAIERDQKIPALNVELDTYRLDPNQPFEVTIHYNGKTPTVRWFDEQGRSLSLKSSAEEGVERVKLITQQNPLARVEITAADGGFINVSEVQFVYVQPIGQQRERVDIAPVITAPSGHLVEQTPRAQRTASGFRLENSSLIADFNIKHGLCLASLRNQYLQKDILAHPEATHLFLIETGGRRYGAEDWQVQSAAAISPHQISVKLILPKPGLQAQLTIGVDTQNLRFGLKITNISKNTLSWKTAFPQIGGLQLSSNADDDYYLFPLYGGVIAKANVNLQSVYGDDSAQWQMTDLFSPSGGAGVTMRSLDESGLYKEVAFRKGSEPVEGGSFIEGDKSGMADAMTWKDMLQASPGSSMAFGYLRYTRANGGSVAAPDALIQMHPDDWHNAMQTYAYWAHRVWKWRPFPSKLRDVWNIEAPGWGKNALFADGKYRMDFIQKTADLSELMSWWTWSAKGPWRVPITPALAQTHSYVVNPATGIIEYPYNRGDYDYNTDWGGLSALKQELQAIRDRGHVVTFYTDPRLADDNTKLGHEFGSKYGVMNPSVKNEPPAPAGYVTDYDSWSMCIDTAWYQHYVTQQMARIVRDTGVDGIRFDEFGGLMLACTNPQHQHLFAEAGQTAWAQAESLMCKNVHEAADKIKPDFFLMTEDVGYDHLAANVEGSLNYESERHTLPAIRPVPLNVFRFYFPEQKTFDFDSTKSPLYQAWRFWNASGAFANYGTAYHPPLYHRILLENGDAFGSRDVHPLEPSLAQGIYANSFASNAKTIALLYNARGFTVNGPMLAAPAKQGYHYFDLLHGEELVPQNASISLLLRSGSIAAIAQLPKVLSAQKVASGWDVSLNGSFSNATIELCADDGEVISEQTINNTKVLLQAPEKGQPVYVKLLRGKYLVDAAALP